MITLNELCAHLLPPEEHMKFTTLILGEDRIILVAAMMAPKATCPDCYERATRIHSWYPRVLADLPWATTPIELRLHVRRFFCPTPGCKENHLQRAGDCGNLTFSAWLRGDFGDFF